MSIKKALAVSAVACFGFVASPSWGVLIPAGTSTGLNYDFSASSLAPNYDFLDGSISLTPGAQLSVFDGLNGTGALVAVGNNFTLNAALSNVRLRDGIFSIIASAAADADASFNATLFGCKGSYSNCTDRQSGTSFSVPEPTGVALLGVGALCLLAATRTRRRT